MGVDTNNDQGQPLHASKTTSISATAKSTANHAAPLELANGSTKPDEDDTEEVVLEDKEDTVIY